MSVDYQQKFNRAIHSQFTNKLLEREYHTVDGLLAHEGFARMVGFIRKHDPAGRVPHPARTRETRRRGRSG